MISLFTTNLRLLNLDLLPDWPNITVSSFSNQDARTKIKCTEYALYQLCRLYDPAGAADKLQPFFPPLEPLQSVNLRAAIYRYLNELKKNGVLSRDTVLRKTMLDDCQGEKFWEMCLAFSAVVLRKVTLEKRSKYGRPLAERLGVAQGVGKSQKESMLPLAVAHRVALSKVLKEKQRKSETYMRLYDLLAEKEHELRERKVRSQDEAQRLKSIRPERLNAVEKAIQKTWVGSGELKDALIDGDTCATGDGMLVTSFDRIWHDKNTKDIQRESNGAEIGLLQNFGNKAVEQTSRLKRWQNYHDKLMASKPASARSSRHQFDAQKPVIHFDRHQNLSLRDPSPDGDEPSPPRRPRQSNGTRYDDILAIMRDALRKNSSQPNTSAPPQLHIQPVKRSQTQPIPLRKPSLAMDVSPGAQDPHRRSPSQTAVPVRPRMGRRVPSQSRLYEKPKVESQREPIPLKAELFSPLKDKRRSSVSPIFANSVLPSPAEEGDSPGAINCHASEKKVDTPISPLVENGLRIRLANQDNEVPLNGGSSPAVPDKKTEAANGLTGVSKTLAVPIKDQATAPAVMRPSLAERTRMSIAFNSAEDLNGDHSQATTPDSDSSQTPDDLPAVNEPQQMFDRRTSLLDRTRQSISMAPPPQQIPKSRKSHNRSRTSVYPVNQFDTPKKDRRSTIGVEDAAKRNATPIEQLLSPDAEYDSVFKSRPKVAHSPVLSPYRNAEVNGSGGLDSDVGRSSPLVGVGGTE